ncbi:MAG: hypothetical protein WBL07_05780 [Thiothrix litoralis]
METGQKPNELATTYPTFQIKIDREQNRLREDDCVDSEAIITGAK